MVSNDTTRELRSLLESVQRQIDSLSKEHDRIRGVLERVERDLPAVQADEQAGIRRLLRWFDRETDELVGSAPLRNVELHVLQQMFDVPADNPMYDCFPVTARQASQLQAYVDVAIELNRFDYFVEADAVEPTRTA